MLEYKEQLYVDLIEKGVDYRHSSFSERKRAMRKKDKSKFTFLKYADIPKWNLAFGFVWNPP